MKRGRTADYRIQCLTDGKVLENLQECCDYYITQKPEESFYVSNLKY